MRNPFYGLHVRASVLVNQGVGSGHVRLCGRETNMKRKLAALGCVLTLAGVLASVAAACHAEISASMDCNGHITFTTTAWDGNPRSNDNISVDASNGLGSRSGSFSRGNGYSFGGSFDAPSGVNSVTLTTHAHAAWGGYQWDNGTRSVTVT